MLHFFIMDNRQVPSPENFNSYSDLFPDILPLADRKGDCITCEFKPTEYFRWSYFRIINETTQHDDRLYFFVRLDPSLLPQTENFVEGVLDPMIAFELVMARRAMRTKLVERIDRDNDRVYIYEGDLTPLNDAVSRSFRKQVIKAVK